MKGDFEQYLTAKETVDDRALDRRVLGRVRDHLRSHPSPVVLEAGTGTAALLTRILQWDPPPDCTYVAVDTDAALLTTARERVLARARDAGFEASLVDDVTAPHVDAAGARTVATLRLRGPARVDVHLIAGDAVALGAAGTWDALLAQAFVDLLTPTQVERLVSGVTTGGCVYFPITFDGGTTFAPAHPADETVLDAYHGTMAGDDGDRLGATAGRRLLTRLPSAGVSLASVGGSDWVVSPLDGAYPAQESSFLDVIVETVGDAVDGQVPDDVRDAWLAARRRHREERRLHFVARNLDLYGRVDR